jgi:hypothetical protein
MYICRELYDGKNADEMCWVQQLLRSKKKKKKPETCLLLRLGPIEIESDETDGQYTIFTLLTE